MVVILCMNLLRLRDDLLKNESPGSLKSVDVFAERRAFVQDVCNKHSLDVKRTTKDILNGIPGNNQTGISKYQMEHMFVDHSHRIMYCFVPKAGSTTWKRIMLMLTGAQNVKSPLDISRSFGHQTQK